MQVRRADIAETDHLARLWHDVWHESHAALAPPELVRLRTLPGFRERLAVMLLRCLRRRPGWRATRLLRHQG